MLKDFRLQFGKDRIKDIGQELIDSGLMGAGASIKSVAKNAAPLKEKVGKEIGEIYKTVEPIMLRNPLNKGMVYTNIARRLQKVEPIIGKEAFNKKLGAALDEILDDPKIYKNPIALADKITKIDKKINYERSNLMKESPEFEKALYEIRSSLRESLNNHVKYISMFLSDKQTGKKLVSLNNKYRNLSDIVAIAEDKALRQDANKLFGLTDTIIGSGGLAASGAGMVAGHPEFLAYSLAALGTKKFVEKYGMGALTTALSVSSKISGLGKGVPAKAIGATTEGLGNLIINRGQSFKKPGLINK